MYANDCDILSGAPLVWSEDFGGYFTEDEIAKEQLDKSRHFVPTRICKICGCIYELLYAEDQNDICPDCLDDMIYEKNLYS